MTPGGVVRGARGAAAGLVLVIQVGLCADLGAQELLYAGGSLEALWTDRAGHAWVQADGQILPLISEDPAALLRAPPRLAPSTWLHDGAATWLSAEGEATTDGKRLGPPDGFRSPFPLLGPGPARPYPLRVGPDLLIPGLHALHLLGAAPEDHRAIPWQPHRSGARGYGLGHRVVLVETLPFLLRDEDGNGGVFRDGTGLWRFSREGAKEALPLDFEDEEEGVLGVARARPPCAGDFDGDGHLDLAVADLSAGRIGLYPRLGSGAVPLARIVQAGGPLLEFAPVPVLEGGAALACLRVRMGGLLGRLQALRSGSLAVEAQLYPRDATGRAGLARSPRRVALEIPLELGGSAAAPQATTPHTFLFGREHFGLLDQAGVLHLHPWSGAEPTERSLLPPGTPIVEVPPQWQGNQLVLGWRVGGQDRIYRLPPL